VVLLERQPADPLDGMSRTMTSAKRLVNSPAAPRMDWPDGTIVHLNPLPGLVEDYQALVERSMAS
jgi:hypothetical protein